MLPESRLQRRHPTMTLVRVYYSGPYSIFCFITALLLAHKRRPCEDTFLLLTHLYDGHTHTYVLLSCCWRSDMITCVQRLRRSHTHIRRRRFVMERSFMTALKMLPTQRDLPLPALSLTLRSPLFLSNHPSAFHHLFCCRFWHPSPFSSCRCRTLFTGFYSTSNARFCSFKHFCKTPLHLYLPLIIWALSLSVPTSLSLFHPSARL